MNPPQAARDCGLYLIPSYVNSRRSGVSGPDTPLSGRAKLGQRLGRQRRKEIFHAVKDLVQVFDYLQKFFLQRNLPRAGLRSNGPVELGDGPIHPVI
jgi:hypothetical protein